MFLFCLLLLFPPLTPPPFLLVMHLQTNKARNDKVKNTGAVWINNNSATDSGGRKHEGKGLSRNSSLSKSTGAVWINPRSKGKKKLDAIKELLIKGGNNGNDDDDDEIKHGGFFRGSFKRSSVSVYFLDVRCLVRYCRYSHRRHKFFNIRVYFIKYYSRLTLTTPYLLATLIWPWYDLDMTLIWPWYDQDWAGEVGEALNHLTKP